MSLPAKTNRQPFADRLTEALAVLGKPTDTFTPGMANRIAGVILGLLFTLPGLGLYWVAVRQLMEDGLDIPIYAGEGKPGWVWVLIPVLMGSVVIFLAGAFIVYVRGLWSFRVFVCPDGFVCVDQDQFVACRWSDVARVLEVLTKEYFPLKGPAKHLTPLGKSRTIALIGPAGGLIYEFDGDQVGKLNQLAKLIRAETGRRGIPWESVESADLPKRIKHGLWPLGEADKRPPDAPYTAADFPPEVTNTLPPGRQLRHGVTTSREDPVVFLVVYSEEPYAPIAFMDADSIADQDDDPQRLSDRTRLDLASRASSGAEIGQPVVIGQESWTGLWEDARRWSEFRVAPTLANVAALRAAGLTWDDGATRLADQFGVPDGQVEEVRQAMRRLIHEDRQAALRRFEQWRASTGAGETSSDRPWEPGCE